MAFIYIIGFFTSSPEPATQLVEYFVNDTSIVSTSKGEHPIPNDEEQQNMEEEKEEDEEERYTNDIWHGYSTEETTRRNGKIAMDFHTTAR